MFQYTVQDFVPKTVLGGQNERRQTQAMMIVMVVSNPKLIVHVLHLPTDLTTGRGH